MYDKEAKPEDFVTDKKSGIKYVKNQLLVSFTMGTPNDWEKMESICQEIDAEIVGYIEFTSDFQIEFKHDKTYEELEELAKKLENRLAGVNQVDGNPVTLRIRTAIQFRADEGVTDENIYERGLQEILF